MYYIYIYIYTFIIWNRHILTASSSANCAPSPILR